MLIDLPMNIQRMEIDPEKLVGFIPPKNTYEYSDAHKVAEKVIEAIKVSERPVIALGNGISKYDRRKL